MSLRDDNRVPDCRDPRSGRTRKAKDSDQFARDPFGFKYLLVGADIIDSLE